MSILAYWGNLDISDRANHWLIRLTNRLGVASEKSVWWSFIHDKLRLIGQWLADFVNGEHRFSQLRQYTSAGELTTAWEYLDRMIIHLLLQIIRPTFKFVISENCFHPGAVCADNEVRFISEPKCLRTHAVHPAIIQSYLIRFATWWHHVIDVPAFELIDGWTQYTDKHRAWSSWLGSGLLLETGFAACCGKACERDITYNS